MWNFFNLKRIRCILRGNYLRKLLDTSTYRYGTQALCFKGSLLCNKIPKKIKKPEIFRRIQESNETMGSYYQ